MKALKSTKRAEKLPRGLWIGRELKRRVYWVDPLAKGPCDLDYYPGWRYRIRKVGLPVVLRVMPSFVQTLTQAREFGRLQFQAAELRQMEELRGAVAVARARKGSVVSVGEFLAAFLAVARERKMKCAGRAVSSLRLVVAIGRGLITAMGDVRMDKDGGRLIKLVDGLSLMEALSEEVKLGYMARMQHAEGSAVMDGSGLPRVNWDKNNPPLVNGTINSTLAQARVCFGPLSRIGAVADLNVPWDCVERFCKLSLPEPGHDVAGDLPTAVAFSKMMAAWATGVAADGPDGPVMRELCLVNELLRLLGLRSGELVMARLSWLHKGKDGRWFLWVRNRPEEGWSCKTTSRAKLPLADDLASRLRGRCAAAVAEGIENPFLILPMVPGAAVVDGVAVESPVRFELIRTRHNAWLKGFIGEVRSGQGNHRLRKFCATRIYAEEMARDHNAARAAARVREYLRHGKEATALLHYIAKDDERLETVTDATLHVGAVVTA